jgi:hydrogenase nickel incorporation protein HypB
MEIKVLTNVMVKNNAISQDNRALFNAAKVFTVNMTSSPGAGKTTLIESTLQLLNKRAAVIEGDLYTTLDAERLQKFEIPLVQINTEGGCHLDARQIHQAVEDLDLRKLDIVFIENVGNLVCPAEYDLGEHKRILLYSITEGEDKPQKYLNMFQAADLILINKVELAELCRIDLDFVEEEIHRVNPQAEVLRISALDVSSLKEWIQWLHREHQSLIGEDDLRNPSDKK